MIVKLRNLLAGPAGVHRAGEVIVVADAFGAQLIEGGYAERVDQPAEVAGVVPHSGPLPGGEGEKEGYEVEAVKKPARRKGNPHPGALPKGEGKDR